MHARWSAYLERFQYLFTHKHGHQNQVADALSRQALLISTLQAELTGFDSLREQYIHDENFQIWWDKCSINDDTGNFIYMMVFC